MAEYRRKPMIINAVRWFKDQDHPEIKVVNLSEIGDGIGNEGTCFVCGCENCDHGIVKHSFSIHDKLICPGAYVFYEDAELKVFSEEYFLEHFEEEK